MGKPGRKPKSESNGKAELCLSETAPEAAAYLKRVTKGEEKADNLRLDAAKYVINQAIGAPKARTELTGAGGDAVQISIIEVARPKPEV